MKRVVFITKNYPPVIGGMETYCYDFSTYLAKKADVVCIANRKGRAGLFRFAFRALFQGLWYGCSRDVIWLGDASLLGLGWLIARCTGCKLYVTAHALDVIWDNSFYQKYIRLFLPRIDRLIVVSKNTKTECLQRGVDTAKIVVITNGINPGSVPEVTISKQQLFNTYALPSNQIVLFSLGRHIERKGIHVFLEKEWGGLDSSYVYIIAGSGPYTERYKEIVEKKGLCNVYFIGRVSEEEKYAWYAHADAFLMPNIHVDGDAEGFGIVCIEAGWHGMPVVTSGIEGISEAVVDGKTGWYVSESTGWKEAVEKALSMDRHAIDEYVKNHFNWEHLIDQYTTLL